MKTATGKSSRPIRCPIRRSKRKMLEKMFLDRGKQLNRRGSVRMRVFVRRIVSLTKFITRCAAAFPHQSAIGAARLDSRRVFSKAMKLLNRLLIIVTIVGLATMLTLSDDSKATVIRQNQVNEK